MAVEGTSLAKDSSHTRASTAVVRFLTFDTSHRPRHPRALLLLRSQRVPPKAARRTHTPTAHTQQSWSNASVARRKAGVLFFDVSRTQFSETVWGKVCQGDGDTGV